MIHHLLNDTFFAAFVCFVCFLFCLLFILIIFQYDFAAYLFIIFSLRLRREQIKPQGLNLSFLARKILLPVILLLTIYVSLIFKEHFCNMLDVCMYVYTFFLANKLTETETSMRGKPR